MTAFVGKDTGRAKLIVLDAAGKTKNSFFETEAFGTVFAPPPLKHPKTKCIFHECLWGLQELTFAVLLTRVPASKGQWQKTSNEIFFSGYMCVHPTKQITRHKQKQQQHQHRPRGQVMCCLRVELACLSCCVQLSMHFDEAA